MGNLFTKSEDERIAQLEAEIRRKDREIAKQLNIIKLLKGCQDSEQCIKDGIIQSGGGDITKEIEEIKKNMDYNFIVFSGGGVKGVSYLGVVKYLSKSLSLEKIKGYAGTSAGSIIASLLAIGLNFDQIYDVVYNLNFGNILDDKYGVLRDGFNFVTDYGLCPGDYIYHFLGEVIKNKTGDKNYTIKQLYEDTGVKLVIVATDMNNCRSVYFSPDNPDEYYQNIPIRLAIRASMSIPGLFEPKKIHGNYCTDGGLLDNYPIHVFDGDYAGEPTSRMGLCTPNPHVLGFNIITDEVINKRSDINNIWDYTLSFIETFLAENERKVMIPSNYKRTINILTPNYPLNHFKLSKEDKDYLIKVGYSYTKNYFKE